MLRSTVFPLLYGAMLLAVVPGASSAAERAGGLALATASIAKLHPASLVAWFGVRGLGGDRRSARALAVAVVLGAVVLAVSLLVFGIATWTDYLAVVAMMLEYVPFQGATTATLVSKIIEAYLHVKPVVDVVPY